MSIRLVLALAAALAAAPAVAQRLPPADGMPLSKIIANVEANPEVRSIRDVEWEDDGYWEISYVTQNGRRGRARLDPMTGATWSRR
ncbi:MAG TPA: PepSY domain-containing protein [Amaricoccus sp.]|uniref:PepSY domain-containing protein n=1 Tax=Amaricoccus sp. TaxID=1872485 RepID=UPI001DDBC019|nr:PepSY domain-containing protein [Amaricoccus sp.]MCB1372232.1 PepSY domain-containing protein [Paracoccaceae bacterium]MCC0066465.1 PepSY domain-containing protein [Rhodovulum sp.]MCB1375995.1 PepSY domain-containing protein [Paracoccaceae bacterium]MCB1401962.1 PepSY domain-containing protein [Paracoccaceae bacterium]HPG23685.1 PepSY domain-containing protein [Amaricoccus sp.]